ncbi:Retrovirus-related Pol polyprotein from transposon TNT 1-94 [Trichinella zimbabwensis]|uniref:Retrovirus-related Pol polyprotein from transposon TNT 1-94 n=1 Tax=Trichinella zimbabwensis TaxID=268475 RepID=A0A0V1I342_9BILA|nr:Retrovirus-related Pol polyprotein from transposon TNT 1-94 [Trichinella zimbabwensis]
MRKSSPWKTVEQRVLKNEQEVRSQRVTFAQKRVRVVRRTTRPRLSLFAIAADEDLKILQFDVKMAFLHGEIDELIFMDQPQCYNDGSGRLCKLQRTL